MSERSSVTIPGLIPVEQLPPRDIRLMTFIIELTKRKGLSKTTRDFLFRYANPLLRVGEIDESPGKFINHDYHMLDGTPIGRERTSPDQAIVRRQAYLDDSTRVYKEKLSKGSLTTEAAREVKEYLVVFFG